MQFGGRSGSFFFSLLTGQRKTHRNPLVAKGAKKKAEV